MADLSFQVVFDNNSHTPGLEAGWGFACLVRGAGRTILFDTGADGEVLLSNMEAMGIDPGAVEVVVISHAHSDHAGGLGAFLGANPAVTVYVPASAAAELGERVERAGAVLVPVAGPLEICAGAHSTGEMAGRMNEQSLVLAAEGGPVVLTGCAHPGLVAILERVRQIHGGSAFPLVAGGFHLRDLDETELHAVLARLRDLEVRRAGPCHCSGDLTREVFHREYGGDYVDLGVGASVEVAGTASA